MSIIKTSIAVKTYMEELKKGKCKRGTLKLPYNPGVGAAKQSFAHQVDINNIVARFQKTGMLEHQAEYEGSYDDMSGMDFLNAMTLVANAKSMFNELPSKIRKMCDNDPAKFYDFCQNPENRDQLIDLGIASEDDFPITPPAEPLVTMPQGKTQSQGGTIQETETSAEQGPGEAETT
jgi:phage internal scaffolding protein